jgi:hypothetical protein
MVDQEDDEKILSFMEQVIVACTTRFMLLVHFIQKGYFPFLCIQSEH